MGERGPVAVVSIEQFVVGAIVGALIVFYFAPTVLAFGRGHAYRWVIGAVNLVAGWTLMGWLICAVWAVWPRERALAEPLIGNPTGTGSRTLGHIVAQDSNQAGEASPSSTAFDSTTMDRIRRLVALRDCGALSSDEFARERDALIR